MTIRGPLAGVRIIEIEGLGPAPFCGMLLADLGADVIVIERPGNVNKFGNVFLRGKERIVLDLKATEGRDQLLTLLQDADGLIEGMRPGRMERLGLSPAQCLARNPRLVYGRMTGWGQDGPLAQSAGHDINFVSVAGAAWYAGQPGSTALPPPTLVGDIGGGAMYLAVGMLAAIMYARTTGKGQVVDAAVVDGLAHMQTLLLALFNVGQLSSQRGDSWIDGAPWYSTYLCADGRQVAVGALEPQFFDELMTCTGLSHRFPADSQFDKNRWPEMRTALETQFLSRDSSAWQAVLEGADACFSPVVSLEEAMAHPHNVARGNFVEVEGVPQARPAPRFSLFPDMPVNTIMPSQECKEC